MVCDAQLAEDVTQGVFAALAQVGEGAKKWPAQNFLFRNLAGQWKLAPLRADPE